MKRLFSTQSLNIFQVELEKWPHAVHTHNFYELILIQEGSGFHMVNDVTFPYKKDDIFLLTPHDYHQFEIQEKTLFTYLKFTEALLDEKNDLLTPNQQSKETKELLLLARNQTQCIIQSSSDKQFIHLLCCQLLVEFKAPTRFSKQISSELFGAILLVVLRNVVPLSTENFPAYEETAIDRLLYYIRSEIGNSEKISQKALAEFLKMSPNYIGIFIKKHTGNSLQSMITETRLKTAEKLLTQSSISIKEIAVRVGFNDSSHMNKLFQKYRGKNPKSYREKEL